MRYQEKRDETRKYNEKTHHMRNRNGGKKIEIMLHMKLFHPFWREEKNGKALLIYGNCGCVNPQICMERFGNGWNVSFFLPSPPLSVMEDGKSLKYRNITTHTLSRKTAWQDPSKCERKMCRGKNLTIRKKLKNWKVHTILTLPRNTTTSSTLRISPPHMLLWN